MKVVVMGAGIVGLASAYFLARDGHEVEVLERREGSALETSFANAGLLVPSQAPPWNAPGVPLRALRWLLDESGALVVRPRPDPAMWLWLLRFAWHSRAAAHRRHARATLALAASSLRLTAEIAAREAIHFDATERGILTLARTPDSVTSLRETAGALADFGIACHILSPEGCLALEPALRPVADELVGGLHTPRDRSGDAHAFAQGLTAAAARHGARLRCGCRVTGLETAGRRAVRAITAEAAVEADAFVLALGAESAPVVRPLGLRLPIYPVKGHSVTFETDGWSGSPAMPVRDTRLKVAVTPLGQRLRVAGMAILDGGRRSAAARHLDHLRQALSTLFPTLPDSLASHDWTGLRPMTPDGPPIIGPTSYANLFLNVGHGALGWTLACGSGAAVAALVSKQPPLVDLSGLTLERFG